jgi:hypothetical protein
VASAWRGAWSKRHSEWAVTAAVGSWGGMATTACLPWGELQQLVEGHPWYGNKHSHSKGGRICSLTCSGMPVY